MKVIRKQWTKDSLIEFLGIKKLYDANPSAEVLCQNDGCLFKVSVRECELSYMNMSNSTLYDEYMPYWTVKCPRCEEKIVLTESKFNIKG